MYRNCIFFNDSICNVTVTLHVTLLFVLYRIKMYYMEYNFKIEILLKQFENYI